MRRFSAWAVVGLVCAITTPAAREAAATASVAEAKKALEAARSNLTKAVERIKKDPPSNPDLDLAMAAVEALKAAIDAGAELEPKDLEYAKAALAARKEHRLQRDYVEERRAKVHIFERRRAIDQALAKLEEGVQRVVAVGKNAQQKDFDQARAAAALVAKELAKGKPLIAQDAGFAGHVKGVAAALASHEATLQEQSIRIGVEKHKAAVEDGRRSLEASLVALSKKGAADAEFEAADRAVAALTKILDDGKPLEKDSGYRSFAERTHNEAKQAKKRIDTLWSEIGIARLRAEIEPARNDLVQAGQALRAKGASADQVAEARTAAIVVRKLLEKIQQRTISDAGFVKYIGEVKKALAEVDVSLQRRSLESTRESVASALEAISSRDASAAVLAAAEDAVKEAKKALKESEPLGRTDASFASYLQDLGKRFKAAEERIVARRLELDLARQRSAFDTARADLAKALRNIERRGATDEQFDEARTAAIVLDKTLEAERPKDQNLARYAGELRTFLRTARTTMDQRRLAVDVDRQRAWVEEVRGEVGSLLQAISANNVPAERLAALEAALVQLQAALADGVPLTKRDNAYAQYDRDVRKRIEETKVRLANRREQLAVEAERSRVEPLLKELSAALSALDGFGDKARAIEGAEKAVFGAEAALAQGAQAEQKLAAYRTWAAQARKTVDAGRARVAKRKLELSADDGRNRLEEKLRVAKASIENAKQPAATDADIAAAGEAHRALAAAIEANAALEQQHSGYASSVSRAKKDLERLERDLELATQARALRKALLEPLASGLSAADAAGASGDIRAQKKQYEKAMEAFKACQEDGKSKLDESSALASIVVMVQGQPSKPKQVIGLCASRAESIEPELKRVAGLVAFEDGPKAFFEKGRSLLSQGNQDAALDQFDECISSGRILQHRHPELADKKLPVAGTTMMLPELIDKCMGESKRLRAK